MKLSLQICHTPGHRGRKSARGGRSTGHSPWNTAAAALMEHGHEKTHIAEKPHGLAMGNGRRSPQGRETFPLALSLPCPRSFPSIPFLSFCLPHPASRPREISHPGQAAANAVFPRPPPSGGRKAGSAGAGGRGESDIRQPPEGNRRVEGGKKSEEYQRRREKTKEIRPQGKVRRRRRKKRFGGQWIQPDGQR